MRQNLISTKLHQDATEFKVSSIYAHQLLRYSVHRIFGDIHTDRRFLKMDKSCSGHLETCKSIENRLSKIFANPILSSFTLEESKKLILYLFIFSFIYYFSSFFPPTEKLLYLFKSVKKQFTNVSQKVFPKTKQNKQNAHTFLLD